MNKNMLWNRFEKHQKPLGSLGDTDMDDKQEQQPKEAPKIPEYSDDEQGPAVNYQMYSHV